tara:strand:+ start:243 stop:518 length:276 start_codon:yes stop_codon:yes gene_type:complete
MTNITKYNNIIKRNKINFFLWCDNDLIKLYGDEYSKALNTLENKYHSMSDQELNIILDKHLNDQTIIKELNECFTFNNYKEVIDFISLAYE